MRLMIDDDANCMYLLPCTIVIIVDITCMYGIYGCTIDEVDMSQLWMGETDEWMNERSKCLCGTNEWDGSTNTWNNIRIDMD